MSKFDESEEALKDLIDYIGQQPIAMDVDLTESSGIQNGGKQEQKIIQKCRHCALKIMEHLTAANSAINIVPFQLLEDIRGEIANVFEPDQLVNFHGFQKFKLLALEILKLSKQLGSYSLEHTKSTSSSDTLILLCTNFYVANVYLKFLFKEIVFFAKENCLSSHGDQSFDQDLINFIVEVATRASQLLTELEKSQNSSPELSAAIQKVDKYITRVIRSRDMLSENQSRDLSKKIASDAANYISSFVQMFEIFKDVSKKHSFDKSILNSLHQCHSDNKSLAQMLSRASK